MDVGAVDRPVRGTMEVKARLRAPGTAVQIVRYDFSEPPDSVLPAGDRFRIELCLSSRHRSARGCFSGQWNSNRFERIGDLFVAPPNLDLRARSDEASALTSIICELDPAAILSLYDRRPELSDVLLSASLDVRDARIRQLLLRLADEARHPGFASEMMVEMISGQMAIEMVRLGATITERQVRGGLAPWQLRRIDERLREVREAPSLSTLSELCRLSVRQLTRSFRLSRDCSIGSYVSGSQMAHAKRLLAGDESVTAIAGALGFSSGSNFGFAFRRATGLTPGQYRQTLLRTH